MSFFKLDTENVSSGFELVAEGKYEAVIVNAEPKQTQAGKPMLNVDFEIRSDVNQPHQGSKVLYNNFTFEHEVAVKIVNSLLKACGFPHGQSFNSPEEMAQALFNKHLEITVKHEADRNDPAKKYAKAKYYDVSKVNAPQQNGPSITVGDSDLPF